LYLATQKDLKKAKEDFPNFRIFLGVENSTTTSPGLQRLLERDGFDSLQQVGIRRGQIPNRRNLGIFGIQRSLYWISMDFLIMFFFLADFPL